jgi:3-oxoacyl-[acyl-carrier-protein] synthase II
MGAVSPLGCGVDSLVEALYAGRSGVCHKEDLGRYKGLRTRVAALVPGMDSQTIPRKFRRSMTDMSIFAVMACQQALAMARIPKEVCAGGQLGVAIGSTVGSTFATENFFRDFLTDDSIERMKSTYFFKIMNHSVASNVAQFLGITGRVLAPSAACATGCLSVGTSYEMVAMGKQQMVLCGGADEFHPLTAAIFDIMHAASFHFNDRPAQTPRPFDKNRDGVVCGEGAGILLLESLDSAVLRGAEILGEVIGFATSSDPNSIANPDAEAIVRCMQMALADARIASEEIGYINAHATATERGDIAEAEAIGRLFGNQVPVSSLKGHLGHTLAASGSLELIASIVMMNRGRLIPTLNLEHPDPAICGIRLIDQVSALPCNALIKNSFALGGVNSSIVVRRYAHD